MIEVRLLPRVPGAYALLIETGAAVALAVRGSPALLPPGRYLYCGSAKGPGGIRGRVARHLRSGKAPHWHVDRLTAAGRVRAVVVAPEGSECALFARFLGLDRIEVPVEGFGSSDCRTCRAHLLRLRRPGGRASRLPLEPSEFLVTAASGRRR